MHHIFKAFVLLVAVFATHLLAEIDNKNLQNLDIDKLKEQLPDGVKIPKEWQNISLPTLDETKNVIRDRCIKVSGSDAAFEEAQQGMSVLNECITELVNVTALQEEIRIATPTGDLDGVFNKYCKKRFDAVDCMGNFTQKIDPCLTEVERENKNIMIEIFTNLLNFVCHKDGDQIALFMAEKGPECLNKTKDDIYDCVNQIYKGYAPEEVSNITDLEALPVFGFGQKECDDMVHLQRCIVVVLGDCEESTPANLFESMFKFIRRKTPCANFTMPPDPHREDDSGGASSVSLAVTALTTTTIVMLLQSFVLR